MSKNKLIGYTSALLLLILVILQFMPFWAYTGTIKVKNPETGKNENQEVEMKTSMQTYIWLPEDNKDCTKYISAQTENKSFAAGDIIAFPVISLLVAAVGIVFIIINPDFKFIFLFPLIVGITGLICLNTQSAFSVGDNGIFTVQMIISAVLAAAGILRLVFLIKDVVKNWK